MTHLKDMKEVMLKRANELENRVVFKDLVLPLADYCEEHDLSPLLVADCGSHAWGFAQETSDWDVKFVYVHNDKDKYLSLREPMQHTEFKDEALNATFSGYDVKKYLNLLLKGNANVYEMVESSYMLPLAGDNARSLRNYTVDVLKENLDKMMTHYAGLSFNTYRDRIRNVGEPTMKKWFYVVRPLLCVEYMFVTNNLPPLEFQNLLNQAYVLDLVPHEVHDAMWKLLKEKREGDMTKVTNMDMKAVDTWVQERHTYWKEYLNDSKNGVLMEKLLTNPEDFDETYRELLSGHFHYE